MRAAVAGIAAFAALASAVPQGVTQAIAPSAPPPAGCSPSTQGTFQITVVNVTSPARRSLERRDILTMTLQNGILKDAQGRTGYIASNYQFQFDAPAQAGAIFTAGFSLCANSSLALGGSAIWYQCLSGDFYNLYDRHWAPQCNAIYLEAMGASRAPQVSALPDGQPQAPTGRPVTQIPDGQAQGGRVSQIPDGQIQAPTGRPAVSQIPDGQIQAPPAPSRQPVMQISDGQIQASPRVPTATRPAVSQIPDGQIQAPGSSRPATTSRPAVSQIPDGQIQAGASRTTTPVVQFTGAASPLKKGDAIAVVAGVAAALAMF